MSSKKHFIDLDILRLLSCLAVLFYHIGLLKGGYLAVCTFFVISGLLDVISAFNKEKFSLKEYYLTRLKKLYIPLLLVVGITISITSLNPDINWINLKPETMSVLFGYNNFWQLNANLDYFTRHISSPFMHFWYIAILFQLDLIFPFLFKLLKKIKEKTNLSILTFILCTISITSTFIFYYYSTKGDIMFVYYHTLTRCFSYLFGLSLGFIYCYHNKKFTSIPYIHYLYLLFLIILFFIGDAADNLFPLYLILTSILSLAYASSAVTHDSKENNAIHFLSGLSYEIYLVQYPVIYFIQMQDLINPLKILLIITLTITSSLLINFALSKKRSFKILRKLLLVILIVTSIYGLGIFITSEDHTEEMQNLKEELKKNEELLTEKQAAYAKNLKAEEEKWNEVLKNLDSEEENIGTMVKNLSVVGVGDSVMLGAVDALYKEFPNGYFDAAISRTAWVANGILVNLKNRGMLSDPVIFNLGANGDCPESCKDTIMRTLDGRKLFWVNATNDKDVHINAKLNSLAEKYQNVTIIDWETISKGHKEYFVADGIHLTEEGKKSYANAIYEALYKTYLEEYKAHKKELIEEYNNKMNNRLTLYGNDLLLNANEELTNTLGDANIIINNDFNYNSLIKDIKEKLEHQELTNRIIFLFDNSVHLTNNEYSELIKLLPTKKVYIVSLDSTISNELNVIPFYQELTNKDYIRIDNIHLTKEGNIALANMIKDYLSREKSFPEKTLNQ